MHTGSHRLDDHRSGAFWRVVTGWGRTRLLPVKPGERKSKGPRSPDVPRGRTSVSTSLCLGATFTIYISEETETGREV